MSEGFNFNAPMAKPVNSGPNKAPATSGKAIASLILGLLSIIGMCFTGIPGLILGIMGISDIGKSGGRVGGKGLAIAGIVLSSLGILWTLIAGILIGMLIPAVHQVRGAARRVQSMNNVRQQVLAMHNYQSSYLKFPKADNNGLSWRVHILPFLEQKNLYDQFNLDEPWDSPHNRKLIPQMPEFYACPSLPDLPAGFTVYQVPYSDLKSNPETEKIAMFDNSDKSVGFGEILDGSTNTIAVLEVDEAAAVEWTKPTDWEFTPSDPMHDLGNLHPGVIVVGMADGSSHSIPINTSPEEFKAMITRNGGEAPGQAINPRY